MFSGDQDPFSGDLVHAIDDAGEANPVQGESGITNGEIQLKGAYLGLTLRTTPSFLELIQKRLDSENLLTNSMPRSNDDEGKQIIISDDKFKASNMNALLLKIGTWERVSKHAGDLVGKCYFAKRKMVWEFLENALLRKIEIEWCDIIAMRAINKENDEPGVLEIELSKPPKLYKEHDPKPKRHTQWQSTTDFTYGQAETYRRHYLLFPSKTLDKLYEKLIQYDKRFFEMRQKGFPSLHSPYFQRSLQTIDFSFPQHFPQNFGQNVPYISQSFNLQGQAIQPYFRTQDSSLSSSVMGSVMGQIYDYHAAKKQKTTNWGQNNILEDNHSHINGDLVDQNQVRRFSMSTVTSIPNPHPPLFAYNDVPRQQVPSLPHLEPNLNPMAYFPKPGNLQQPVSYSYMSQRNITVPRFVEATHGDQYQENAFTSPVIINDTSSTHEQADSSLPDYYSSCFYDQAMEGLDSIIGTNYHDQEEL